MKNENMLTIHAKNGNHGLDIYVGSSGQWHYILTRRASGLLWTKLKDGVTVGELRRLKPQNTRLEQKYYHASRYLLKVVKDYLRYDMSA